MLAIRMQRTGRKGHAMFRMVVQESHLTPTSGKVVAQLGHYDPHTKQAVIVKDKAEFYLGNGAQPSERVARILESEGITLPKWYKKATPKTGALRNPDKLRKNQPAEEPAPEAAVAEASAEAEVPAEQSAADEAAPVEAAAEEEK